MIGILCGALALAALIIGSAYGDVHEKALNPKLVAWICAFVIVLFGIIATARLSTSLSQLASKRNVPAVEGAVKYTAAIVGYLIVALSALAVLDVSVERLLVGAGLLGVVLGIAAQQSLGNIFAGLVLILARPFVVGDHIRIRSGALGGIFDAWVLEMSLTYVTLRTDDGQLKIPNTAMLAAGVGKLPPGTVSPAPATPGVAKTGGPQAAPAQTAPAQTAPAQTVPAMSAPAGPGLVSTDGGQAAAAQAVVTETNASDAGPSDARPSEASPTPTGPLRTGPSQPTVPQTGASPTGASPTGASPTGAPPPGAGSPAPPDGQDYA